jgi:hypothetical protein
MRVMTDVATGEVDPGACVWCRERAVKCGIAVRGYTTIGKKRPRKKVEDEPRKKPRSEKKDKGKAVDPTERDGLQMVLEEKIDEIRGTEVEVPEEEMMGIEIEVPEEETMATEVPVAEGLGVRLKTPEGAPTVRPVGSGVETSSEVPDLISAVRELTEVVREGFRELREANHLQRLVNEDLTEKIRNRNWRKYERMARREE